MLLMLSWTWSAQLANDHRAELLAAARRQPRRGRPPIDEPGILRRLVHGRRTNGLGVGAPAVPLCAAC